MPRIENNTVLEIDGGDVDGYDLLIEYSCEVTQDDNADCDADGNRGRCKTFIEDVRIEDLLVDGISILPACSDSLKELALKEAKRHADNHAEDTYVDLLVKLEEHRREAY